MFYKPASQITEDDLQGLVSASATEDNRLEFKSEMYGQEAEQVREMIRDMVAMANHRGGLILIGVEEDGDGVAIGVPGIEGGGHVERITSSAQANIERRLNGLEVVSVPLANGRCVIAIGVPESLNGPHMITYRTENRFWRRYGRQKDRMSVDEIEAAFMNRIEAVNRVEAFLAERRSRENIELAEQRCVTLQAAPVFIRDEMLDIRDQVILQMLWNPPSHPQL